MIFRARIFAILSTALLGCLLASPSAVSREWRQTPDSAARNYALILDARSPHEMVLVFWFVPQMVPDTPGADAAKKLLKQYAVVGIAHAHVADTGTMTFDDVPAVKLTLASGEAPARIADGALPPSAMGMVTAVQTVFRQSLGKFGEGMKWFYFDGASVDSCGKGRVTVAAVDENYTYDTPIPGCPAP